MGRARVKILTDAQLLADRVSPPASWEEARDALDGCKWYRVLLGPWMDAATSEAEAALKEVFELLVTAWPNTASVQRPKKCAGNDNGGKGMGKGKSKGKSKANL